MKKILLLLIITLSILACSSVKKTQEAINYGNYDEAISIALKHLRNNKTKKGNQSYVLMLEEAFSKVINKNLDEISYLEQDSNPANIEAIYNTYLILKNRQEMIKPLLPLAIFDKGRNAKFQFRDYSNDIINAKNKLSSYLLSHAQKTLSNSNDKYDYRKAYDDLKYLEDINPNFKNTRSLMNESHNKGTNYVFVSMYNASNKVIPMGLERDLLNFDTYRLNDFWTVYHSNRMAKINYDFGLNIDLREINISPEQIREKEIKKEKRIKDGWKYLTDTNGNVVKDSIGNDIKIDKFKTVRCKVYEINQLKSVQVVGQVKYINFKTNQLLESFPLVSEFIFDYRYATYSGNKDALDKRSRKLTKLRSIPFPTNEQMIFDSGEDLKRKIKRIITRHGF